MARQKQKPKRARQYDPNRYPAVPRGAAKADVAATDELIRWIEHGQAGTIPPEVLSPAAAAGAAISRDQLLAMRNHVHREEPPLSRAFDECIRWVDAAARGIIPPEPLGGSARQLIGGLTDGLRQTRRERVRG